SSSSSSSSSSLGFVEDISFLQNAFNQKNNPMYYYQATDIITIQQEIMSSYSDRFTVYHSVGDAAFVQKAFKEMINLTKNKPALFIYNLSNIHWVTFAALNINNTITVLYKDSGGVGNESLAKKITKISDKAKFYSSLTKEQISGVDCGIF